MNPLALKAWRALCDATGPHGAPVLSHHALDALRRGLEVDDERILQGATTIPPPLQCVADFPVEAGDLLVFAYWQGDCGGVCTVGEAEAQFTYYCTAIDGGMGEGAGCRHLLHWFDEAPREDMRTQLLAAVRAEQARRSGVPAGVA